MDVVGYVRVSTADQKGSGLGLQAQRSAIRSEAKRRGWNLIGIEEDAGVSGKSLAGRAGLDAAVQAVASRQAQALVVSKLDRLSRSLLDFAALMAQSQKQGWALVAMDLGVDTTTPAGEFMASVLASAAQWERRLIGQRTKDALAVKKAQGVTLGRPRVLSDEVVSMMTELRDSGLSYQRVADELNDRAIPTAHGGRQWHGATVRKALGQASIRK